MRWWTYIRIPALLLTAGAIFLGDSGRPILGTLGMLAGIGVLGASGMMLSTAQQTEVSVVT